MKIGIISDTHGRLPDKVLEIFKSVELIIHAGDVGNPNILTDLQTIAPVEAVYGNTDTYPLVSQLRAIEFFTAADLKFNLVHNLGSHKRYLYELFKLDKRVDIVIHGHTHRIEDITFNDVRFINPGSPNMPRGSGQGSVAILTVSEEIGVEFKYL
jgi:putative phosphoesterase